MIFYPMKFRAVRIKHLIKVCSCALAPFASPLHSLSDKWVEAINAGNSLVPSLREGVYSQLLMDLTQESNATGTWVNVPELDKFLVEI